jgi:hypothetical protein
VTPPPPSEQEPADPATRRLQAAYQRYESAYRSARPGTAAAAHLAQARLDLTLLLEAQAVDGELPSLLTTQLVRDAQTLLATTPELREG